MKTYFFFTACLMSVVLFSCQNNAAEKASVSTEQTAPADHQHAADSPGIELDNGAKWKVNQEMAPYVQQGREQLEKYTAIGGTDYKQLATQLEAANNQLIESCTMQGKSHDELHKWLHPHIQLVSALSTAADQAAANRIIAQLKDSYQQYNNYFE